VSSYARAQTAADLGPLFAKREGIARVEGRNPELAELLREHARSISNSRGWVTIDDVRAFADSNGLEVPSPHFWGSIFRGPEWECVGFELSKRPGKNAHRQPRWHWKGSEAGA
jgi:hypothetical protein